LLSKPRAIALHQASRNIHVKLCHSKKNSINCLEFPSSSMPFLVPLHKCRNISAGAHKRGQAEGDTRGTRKKSEMPVNLARAPMHVHESGRASGRFHVLDAFRHMNLAESGARPGRCRGGKGAKRLKIAMQPTKSVGEALIYSHVPLSRRYDICDSTPSPLPLRNEISYNKSFCNVIWYIAFT